MLNFNIAPYYDDFSDTKHFYRILFRPSVAVQARELTQTQSILQQQIKNLGDSIYQHGSMVIPGQIATDPKTNYVCLNPTYGMIGSTPIPVNLGLFNNQIIQGQTTGLQAQVVYTLAAAGTTPNTVYVKYLNTGTTGATVFASGEVLTLLNSSNGLATVQTNAPTGLAISAQIDEGVYYIWGFFVRVEQQYLLLNNFSNVVSCRVGLEIVESIITPEEDPSLDDNAQGSSNYAAPGAHRYKIDLILTSKSLTDTSSDANFVELVRLVNSLTQTKTTTDTYSVIMTELATRMADANGNFAVRPFAIDIRESLDTSFVIEGTATGASVEVISPAAPATISLAANASSTDNAYNNFQIYLTNGSGAGQTFVITGYTGATKTATLDQNYVTNQVADTTTEYIISNPLLINRGIYPPDPTSYSPPLLSSAWPPPYGNTDELAVGMESGRAYVDGYRIDTLSTTYVLMNKARDSGQAVSSQIPTPVGNYMFVKNLSEIPLVTTANASPDFLTIQFSNLRHTGSQPGSGNIVGNARVHSIEFFQGISAADSGAVFKLYLFEINMNPGVDINTVRSFYLINNTGHNNTGDGLNAWGDVCTVFGATNINATTTNPSFTGITLVAGATITGPAGVGTETVVYYDPINNIILTEPNVSNGTQILTNGQFTSTSGTITTTGVISNRTQIFNTTASTLIYPLSTPLVKTIRASDTSVRTSYNIRKVFEATGGGSGNPFIFNTTSTAPFAPFNSVDYLACIVADPGNSANVGKFIDLTQYVNSGSFSGSPANTTLSFIIGSGLGADANTTIKLMATVNKQQATEKLKVVTSTSLTVNGDNTSNPPAPVPAVIPLGVADIISIDHVYDLGQTSYDSSLTYPDITNQYAFDTGQRDYFYDIGNLIKYPNAPTPSGNIIIFFTYYAHSGQGDYFSVDSYSGQTPYAQIPTYAASNGVFYVLRDCMDFRPRKDNLDFGFSLTGSSFSYPLQPSNVGQADFQFYLGRIDKIYLDEYGNFNVIEGTSALNPQPPADPLDGMMLYTIQLNPYTLSTADVTITPTSNPVYTMQAIGKLEQRIANLEYYTSLNQLETSTANYTITDTSTGLDRFKNGFVVDNFTGHSVGNVFDPDYNCAIDPVNNILRPVFVQQNNSLIFQSSASSGYVERCGLVMLPYVEAVTIQQPFATDIINVNPFAVFTYYGDIALTPSTDEWYDTVQLPVINVANDSALDGYQYLNQWSSVTWGDWQTSWVGTPQSTSTSSVTTTNSNTGNNGGGDAQAATIQNLINTDPSTWVFQGQVGAVNIVHINGTAYATGPEYAGEPATQVNVNGAGGGGGSTTTSTTTTVSTTQQIGQTQVGTQSMVTAQLSSTTINNSTVGTSVTPYIRSRRIKVVGRHFKPNTRLYAFFDNTDVNAFCRPYCDPQITPSLTGASWTVQTMIWGGDYDPQTNTTGDEGLTTIAGDTGDSASYLVGPLGSAMYTDNIGTITAFFEIPCTTANEFRVGTRDFRLSDDPSNSVNADSYGDANYTAAGVLQQTQETITSIYTPEVVTKQVSQSQVITQNLGTTTSTTSTTTPDTADPNSVTLWLDPLAQSFLIKEQGGCYVTSVSVFFQTADSSVPITMQIRNMVNGYPGQDVVPFSEKILYPNNPTLSAVAADGSIPSNTIDPVSPAVINVSDDASVATTFVFDVPIFLEDGTDYCFVLIANSVNYFIYTAKIGDTIIGSTNIVSTPPYLGNLFKSQNASTWVADPSQNMKFIINKAQFDPTVDGEVYFTNSSVQADTLNSIPFQMETGSNVVRVYHLNHQMPQGDNVNSVVNLSNIPTGTYNGITAVQLNGTFSITNVDLHSYTIQVAGTDFSGVTAGRTGPDGVIATRNIQFDSICPNVNQLTPTGSSVAWTGQFTTGRSVNINSQSLVQEPYIKDLSNAAQPITINTTSNFTTPRMLASDINETTSIVGASVYDRKSMVLHAEMSTTSANLTPLIDTTRVSAILINNQLDDPTFENYTIENMDEGITVTSTSGDPYFFNCQVIVSVVAVTGGAFAPSQGVSGAASGATGTVVSWDGSLLTLSGVSGTFQLTEAITNNAGVVGTVQNFNYQNTITHTGAALDFSVFIPGYDVMIAGDSTNPYPFDNPVTVLSVNGNVLTVNAPTPFQNTPSGPGAENVQLTQFIRFVAESGPSGCTTSSRYITRQFNLANPSNSLSIIFTVNLPPGAFVDVYYRTLAANSTAAFNTIPWVLAALDSTVDSSPSTTPTQFKDYSYTANNIGLYTAFSVKIVMRGGNSSQVPQIQAFRAIALAT